jgi:hypothetical protein
MHCSAVVVDVAVAVGAGYGCGVVVAGAAEQYATMMAARRPP